jgi:hypothetical protein
MIEAFPVAVSLLSQKNLVYLNALRLENLRFPFRLRRANFPLKRYPKTLAKIYAGLYPTLGAFLLVFVQVFLHSW